MLVASMKPPPGSFVVLPFSHDRAIMMNYRIDLVVIAHSFYHTEFFTHIQKPKEASHSKLAALASFSEILQESTKSCTFSWPRK
jgi:hypothetical protein